MNILKRTADSLSQNKALDPIGERYSQVVEKLLDQFPDRRRAEDALHGKWLGHPLHPVLTDLPMGAWSFGFLLDAADAVRGKQSPATAAAFGFGILTALPTALAGAVDWRQTDGGASRVGVAHALLNSAALGMFGTSLVLRRNHVGLGRLLSTSGIGLIAASGYLGGHLVSNMRVGVIHEAEPAGGATFPGEEAVEGGLTEDTPRQIEVDGAPIMVVKHGGVVYALSDVCPHLGCSLSDGTIEGDAVVCPCHGSTFALEDGRVLAGPSVFPVASYKPGLPDRAQTPGPVLDPGME